MEKVEHEVARIHGLRRRASDVFGDDPEVKRLVNALIEACFKIRGFAYHFEEKPRAVVRRLVRDFICELLMEGSWLDYDEDLRVYAGKTLKHEKLPEEGIADYFCRAAREPARCPWCNRYVAGSVNEVWID